MTSLHYRGYITINNHLSVSDNKYFHLHKILLRNNHCNIKCEQNYTVNAKKSFKKSKAYKINPKHKQKTL